MKIDLGIAKLDIPKGYAASTVIALGKEDQGKALSAGLTVAKTKTPKYRRTLAINMSAVPVETVPEELLGRGLADVQQRAQAKVVKVEDVKLSGQPAKTAELRHTFDDMPVMTYAMLTFANGYVQSVMLTVLDDPKVLKQARAEFDQVLSSLEGK